MLSYILIWLLNSGVCLINLDLVLTAEKSIRKEVIMKQKTNTADNSAEDLNQGGTSLDKVSLVA
jgi:hypothetical protein